VILDHIAPCNFLGGRGRERERVSVCDVCEDLSIKFINATQFSQNFVREKKRILLDILLTRSFLYTIHLLHCEMEWSVVATILKWKSVTMDRWT